LYPYTIVISDPFSRKFKEFKETRCISLKKRSYKTNSIKFWKASKDWYPNDSLIYDKDWVRSL